MGILNVTPDSFSDGDIFLDPDVAVRHGLHLMAAGADIVDVGGESTRPGALRVSQAEELRRVLPVVRRLVAASVPVSIDTTRSVVAEAALSEGALMVNDVSGGLADPRMTSVMAACEASYVAMHWRGHSANMRSRAQYGDVLAEVRTELASRVDALTAAGVSADRLILDPGLGFAKSAQHDWELVRRLSSLTTLGVPLLVGPSRKSFLRAALPPSFGYVEAAALDAATAAVSTLVAAAGASWIRVHDPASTQQAIAVADTWVHGPRRIKQLTSISPADVLTGTEP
jgi:dihydropteroate synthase